MRYRNTKTGAIIDSSCAISGGDWVLDEAWIAQLESDGKVHVRPIEHGEIKDTPVESKEDYTEKKTVRKKR